MTSQLNPAWQHKTASSDHLAKIGARFLSDEPQRETATDACQVIPFLLDNPAQDWVTRELCSVLARRGHRSLLYPSRDSSGVAALAELETALREQAASHELCLFPTTSVETIRSGRFDHVVLLVPASLDDILTAYRHIKLLSQQHKPDIGIVMIGPRDQHAAWRYFRKLAVGSLRYLDVPLLNLGFLPRQVMPGQPPAGHHRENFLTRISERLLRSGFHDAYRPRDPE